MATVKLVKENPIDNPRRRRRGRRTRRNPDLVRTIKEDLPDLSELGGALLGVGVAMQVPVLINKATPATGWKNVIYSGIGVIGGTILLRMMKAPSKLTIGFGIGGASLVTAKALSVATKGKWGIDPGATFAPDITGVQRGMAGAGARGMRGVGQPGRYQVQPGPGQTQLPPPTRQLGDGNGAAMAPVGRGTGAFRLDDVVGNPNEPTLF